MSHQFLEAPEKKIPVDELQYQPQTASPSHAGTATASSVVFFLAKILLFSFFLPRFLDINGSKLRSKLYEYSLFCEKECLLGLDLI